MSGGKSFAPVNPGEKSPEERLADLEQRLPVMIQKIQSYDEVLNEFKSMKMALDGIVRKIQENKEDVSGISFDIDALNKKMSSLDVTFIARTNDLHNRLYDVTNEVMSVKKSHEGLNTQILDAYSAIHTSHEKISEKMASKADVELHSTNHMSHIRAIHDMLSKINIEISRLDGQDSIQSHKHSDLTSIVSNCQDKNKEHDSSIQDLSKDLNVHKKSILDTIQSLQITWKGKLESAINEVRSYFDSNNNVKNVGEDLSKKMENVSLDASNAVLKSSNNTQQLTLIERKIENIYLLLKKHELNQ